MQISLMIKLLNKEYKKIFTDLKELDLLISDYLKANAFNKNIRVQY